MTLTSEDKDYNARHIKELQAEIEKLRAENAELIEASAPTVGITAIKPTCMPGMHRISDSGRCAYCGEFMVELDDCLLGLRDQEHKECCAYVNREINQLRAENAELKARLERTEKSGTGQPDFTKVGG